MLSVKKLQDFGLSDKEAKVYMALLELGQGTAQNISIRSGVNRATVYVMLESLMKRGLASTVEKAGKTLFLIEEPYAFLKHLESEKVDVEDRIAHARKIVPELQQVYNISRDRSHVRLIEGKETGRVIRNEILRSKTKELLQIINVSLSGSEKKDLEMDQYRDELSKKYFKVRRIIIYKDRSDLEHMVIRPGVTVRILAFTNHPFESEMTLFDGKKIILGTVGDDPIGIVIENQQLFSSMKALFEASWRTATEMA